MAKERDGNEQDTTDANIQPGGPLIERLGAAWVPAVAWEAIVRACSRRPTERELQVLQGIVGALEDEQIAEVLGISVSTVRTHIEHLYIKLGCHSRAAAVSASWRARESAL